MEKVKAGSHGKIDEWAQRAGLTREQYLVAADAAACRAPDVPAKIRHVASLARRHGAVMLSHDERTCDERAAFREHGVSICEFPLAPEVAAEAVAGGEHVVMGAPNVIRGGSHMGALSAEDAIRDGICTVLASDYYYPSLFHAAQRLVERGVQSVGEVWSLISGNPAAAMGLHDRGTIDIGRRADIVVIDCSPPWRLIYTVIGGAVMRFGR